MRHHQLQRLRPFELAQSLLELSLPPRCAACDAWCTAETLPLCGPCRTRIPEAPDATAPPGLDFCVAAAAYSGAPESWLRRFKYPPPGIQGLDPASRALVRELVRIAVGRAPGAPPDRVVPVPLHPRRLRARGFNPAAVLCDAVARALGVRFDTGSLRRIRDTPSQTGLDRRARVRNVAGAFRCRRPMPPRVWIVDDVVTTGSTLAACARGLRLAGAREVGAVCAAWTPAVEAGLPTG